MTPEQADEILRRITEGESVAKICTGGDLPKQGAFYLALTKDEALAERYARAREAQAHVYAHEIVDIADDLTITADHKRVMTDARKWAASKLAPKKYGDKMDLNHSGSMGLTISKIESVIVDPVEQSAISAQQNGTGSPD